MWEQMSSVKNSPKTSSGDEEMETVGPTSCVKGAMSTGVSVVLQVVELLRWEV